MALTRRGFTALPLALAATALPFRRALAADKLKIALTVGTATGGVMLMAKDKGFFEAEGLDVDFFNFDPPQLGVAATVRGDINLYGTSMNPASFNAGSNGDLIFISGLAAEKPGFKSSCFATSVKNYDGGIKSPKDLAGQRIGVGSIGSSLQYSHILLGKKYGFPTPPGTFVPLGAAGNIVGALVAGSIGGAVVPGASALQAEKDGQIKILGWVGDEVPFPHQAVFVGKTTMASQREVIVRAMRALLRSAALYDKTFQQKDASGNFAFGEGADELIAIIAKGAQITPAAVRAGLPYIDPKLALSLDDVTLQVKDWQGMNLLDGNVDPRKFFDGSILQAASAPK